MTVREPYNQEVRTRFANPVHAGDLEGTYAEVLAVVVAESEQGARIALSAGVADGMIAEFRFRAWGCPHLIAAAELACAEHENGPLVGLAAVRADELMARLSVPAEKTGRILLVEDAIRSLLRQHAG